MFVITKNAEAKLLEAALSLKEEPYGYYALIFHFSRLQKANSSDYQIKIAINILHDLFKNIDGGVFLCEDKDLFLLSKDCGKALIEKAIFQLRYLFSEDPLAYKGMDQENEEFCAVYDLEFHVHEFVQRCKRKVSGASIQDRPKEKLSAEPSASLNQPLTPNILDRVLSELEKVDIQYAIRKQPVCALVKGKSIQPVFHEMYVHLSHLKRLLSLEINLTANLPMLWYLKQQLDKRVISLIRQQPRFYLRDSISLNFTVSTLLSREFAELNTQIDPSLRALVVIEISAGDVFADMLAYFTAQRFLKSQGYRLCLDGLNSYSFLQINRENLGFDLVKLEWNADTERHLNDEDFRRLSAAVQACGKNRVILARCDSKFAIDYGQSLGLSLFQGRHLDKILNPNAKVEN